MLGHRGVTGLECFLFFDNRRVNSAGLLDIGNSYHPLITGIVF